MPSSLLSVGDVMVSKTHKELSQNIESSVWGAITNNHKNIYEL